MSFISRYVSRDVELDNDFLNGCGIVKSTRGLAVYKVGSVTRYAALCGRCRVAGVVICKKHESGVHLRGLRQPDGS